MNRYNGNEFVQFHTDSSRNSLPAEDIYKLLRLDEYRLAAATMGLHIINTRNGNFINIIIPPGELKYEFKVNAVISALSNKQESIFILTKSGFYHYNKNNQLVFRFDYYTKEQADKPFGFADNIVFLNENSILIQGIDGLYIYNASSSKIEKINSNDYPLFADFADLPHADYLIRQIEPGSFIVIKTKTDIAIHVNFMKNRKVISALPLKPLSKEFQWPSELFRINDTAFFLTGFSNGFFKLIIDEATGKINLDIRKHFSKYFCSAILSDKDGRLWIGTSRGIFKQDNRKAVAESMEIPADVPNQFPAPQLLEVFVYGDKLFAASGRAGGLLIFDKNSLKLLRRISFKKYFHSSNTVFSISHSNDDTLLIGTNGPLFWLNASNGKYGEVKLEGWDKFEWITAQFRDSHGNIWITTNKNTIHVYEAAGQKFKRLVQGESHREEKIFSSIKYWRPVILRKMQKKISGWQVMGFAVTM